MRDYGATNTAHLAATGGIIARNLLRVTAIDPVINAVKVIEIWDGQTDRVFTADGILGQFVGVSGAIHVGDLEFSVGTDAHRYDVVLTGLPPVIDALFKSYDLRSAPVQAFSVLLNPVTPVDTTWRNINGFIDDIEIKTGAAGQSSSIKLTIATTAIALHYGINRKLSDAAHQQAVPGIITSSATSYGLGWYTVTLGAVQQISLSLFGGGTGSGGYSNSGNWHYGNAGQPTTAVVQDSSGAILATYTAPGGSSVGTGSITGVSGGSVVFNVGQGGLGGGDGAVGSPGSASLFQVAAAPSPDRFFRYQSTAGEVRSIWS